MNRIREFGSKVNPSKDERMGLAMKRLHHAYNRGYDNRVYNKWIALHNQGYREYR